MCVMYGELNEGKCCISENITCSKRTTTYKIDLSFYLKVYCNLLIYLHFTNFPQLSARLRVRSIPGCDDARRIDDVKV
jgi:hypothetical protein